MLPSLQLLEQVSNKIKSIPNRRKESKRNIHYCLFLLGYKSGLRISEAVNFSLENKTKEGLYRVEKPKGKKERLVYIPKKVIRELRKHNWKPNQTNRWNFYHFLRKIKRELNISEIVELTPHTLRHAFATYHAENGLSLPILSKMLGHASIRTTALYWRNVYQEPDGEVDPILVGKRWLESKDKEPSKPPIMENFPEVLKPTFIDQEPVILHQKPTHADNSLSTPKTIKKTSGMLIDKVSPRTPEKFSLNPTNKKINQLKTNQPPSITSNQEQKPTKKELILLQKIKLLERQLSQLRTKNSNLKAENRILVRQNKVSEKQQNHHLKALVQQFQERQSLVGDQKAETQAQIIQPLP